MCIFLVSMPVLPTPCGIRGEMMQHDALLAQGWQLQTTIDEPRLSELAENYRSLGYEVLIVREGVTLGCGACDPGSRVGGLYLRRGVKSAHDGIDDDDLFAS